MYLSDSKEHTIINREGGGDTVHKNYHAPFHPKPNFLDDHKTLKSTVQMKSGDYWTYNYA